MSKVLKKRDRIIGKFESRCRKKNMKFGVEIPEDAKEARRLNEKNGNRLWQNAIEKEIKNSKMAFRLLSDGEKAPPGYSKITYHLVFDVKYDLTRKARYVAGGHLTEYPSFMTYSNVASRDSVRIGFLLAALNGLEILVGYVQNAFLHAQTKEKHFFFARPE